MLNSLVCGFIRSTFRLLEDRPCLCVTYGRGAIEDSVLLQSQGCVMLSSCQCAVERYRSIACPKYTLATFLWGRTANTGPSRPHPRRQLFQCTYICDNAEASNRLPTIVDSARGIRLVLWIYGYIARAGR